MRKVLAVLFTCGLCVYAADFWQKPASEWSDKDVQKMLNNSPWAKPFSIPMSGPATSGMGNAQGNSGVDPGNAAPISEGGGGGRGGGGGGRGGGGGGRGGDGGGGGGFGGASIDVVARWQSALPEKQAFARLKYGAEAATSADAKQMVDRVENGYLIVITGNLRPFMRNQEAFKKTLQETTALSVKGKAPLKVEDMQVSPQQIMLLFSKEVPLTVDDKEVELTAKMADVVLKYKFKLKDMVFNGKLEL